MHILKYLYLLDFFTEEKMRKMFSDVIVREVEEVDFANKIFLFKIKGDVSIVLDIGIYSGNNNSTYIECHMYVVKDDIWTEEYDMVYLKNHQKESRFIVNLVKEGVRSIREEIKEKNLPIKVYNTTRQKYKIAKNLTDQEIEDYEEYIEDIEHNDLPYFKQEMDLIIKEEKDRVLEDEENLSKEADKVILNSLKNYYKEKVDNTLKDNDKENFIRYSKLYVEYSEKLKKMYL